MTQQVNDHLVLIVGESGTGKSASLRDLENPDRVAFFNCEAGKKLPFRAKFKEFVITDPLEVYAGFEACEDPTKLGEKVDTIVIDTQTYLMDMYESLYIVGNPNTQAAWGAYAQYFQNLMQQYVAKSTKNVIFLAHSAATHNETEMVIERKVPVKGSLAKKGIESFFSLVVATKKMELKKLKGYENDLLVITPQEEALGFKHVYQTQPTKETVHDRIRGPMGMWTVQETFIDNNAQYLINRLREYYA